MDYSKIKKAQLIEEAEALQVKIAELERAEAERVRAEEEIKQRNRELAALNAITSVVSQSLNLEEILNAGLDKALELMHLNVGGIYLADPARRKLDLVVHRGISKEFFREVESVSVDEKTLEAVMAEGKLRRFILSVKAVTKDRVELKRILSAMKKEGLSLASGVPVLLQAKEEILGLMIVASRGPRQYSEAEQGLLISVAQQIAVAIQNARLYQVAQQEITERKRAEERIEHLNLVLRAIRRVNQLIARERDRDRLLQGACDGLIETRGYHNAWSALLDEAGGLVTTAEAGLGGEEFTLMVERLKRGELTACGRRALTQSGVVATEDPPSACADCPLSATYGGRGAMIVRMEHGRKVYGLLSASIPAHLTADREEQILFGEVAGDIAFALHSIELEEERVRAEEALELKVKQLAALSQAPQVVTASLELDQVLAGIVSLASEVVSTDYISVVLVDKAGNISRSAENLLGVPGIEYRIRDRGLTRWIVHSRQAGVIDEIGEDGAIIPDLGEGAPRFANPPIVETGIKSVAGLPLMVKDRLLGVLYLHSLRANAFHGQLPLLTTFASQVAIAVDNARLYEALKQELAERVWTEEALRESERRFRALTENSADGIALLDAKGAIRYKSPTSAQALGYSVGELVGMNVFELTHPDDVQSVSLLLSTLVEKPETPLTIQFRFRHKDGSWCWLEATGNNLLAEPAVQAIVVNYRDITERVRAERLLRALNQAARAIGKAMTPEEVFTAVAEEFKKLGSPCVVLLTDESRKRLLPKYLSYETKAIKVAEKLTGLKAEDLSIPVETVDVYRKAIRERKSVLVENVEEAVRQLLPKPANRFAGQIAKMLKVSNSIAAPLIVEDEIIGVLSVQSDDLTEEDIPAITAFANQMAAAWHKASLLQDLQRSLAEREQAQEELQRTAETLRKTLGATIQAMAATVETRDPYTAGHQRRVADLARAIADEMGLSKEQIDGIRMAGLIHDLGKITIPAEILSKPTQLNEFEWGIIQAHPQVGYDLLKTVDFMWPVAQIVLQHHERMDGSGYPQGLSGEEIMLEARILAVADVVEAMASYRPYRPARGIDEALEEISRNRDILYDPEVVDACLKLFTEKGFEFEKSSTRS
jgi:PAS domain S-box-containing protein